MIITRTPFRMSFVGGGSDLPSYYLNEPGRVISTTINKYMYVSVHKKFFKNIRVNYSQTEEVDNIIKIKHPIIRETLRYMKINDDIEISSLADIPSRGSGLGSSSSYCVGLLNALHLYKKIKISKNDLAEKAFMIESEFCGEPGGKQDQYAASFGGLKEYTFNPNKSVNVEAINVSDDNFKKLSQSILMFYTGMTRKSSLPLHDVIENINSDKTNLDTIRMMSSLCRDFKDNMINGDIKAMGEILDKNWQLKRSLSKIVSSDEIDELYKKALKSGAFGGKILGAGNGGFLMFIVPKDRCTSVKEALSDLRFVDIKFEKSGTQQVLNDNDE